MRSLPPFANQAVLRGQNNHEDHAMKSFRFSAAALLLPGLFGFALLLSACAPVGPDYVPPQLTPPPAWSSPLDEGLVQGEATDAALARWWEGFADPLLSSYVRRALAGNEQLAQARASVVASRARRDLAAAGLAPDASLGASLSRQGGLEQGADHSTRYGASLDSLWELDLFGGQRRTVEAAENRVAANELQLRDLHVSLAAEVALAYVEVRTLQRRLAIASDSLAAQERLLFLTAAKRQAGLVGELALQQAQAQTAAAKAQLPVLRTSLEQEENGLATLLGLGPGSLREELRKSTQLPEPPSLVGVALPAEVLQRRPDVRRAERLLAAQVAEVGAAEAARYPTLRLSGVIALDALSLGDLFSAAASTYAITPRIFFNFWDGGAAVANVRLQSALAEEALAAYRGTVLAALAEVDDVLIATVRQRQRQEALEESARAAGRALALAEVQYRAGLVELTTVLEAHRTQLSALDQQETGKAALSGNLVKLYKALGGGWQADDGSTAPSGEAGKP